MPRRRFVVDFVHKDAIPRQLRCGICSEVCHRAVMTPCEHLFCEDCLIEWFSRCDPPRCPCDNIVINPESVKRPIRLIRRMVDELTVRCGGFSRGCCWQGTLEAASAHAETCPHHQMVNALQRAVAAARAASVSANEAARRARIAAAARDERQIRRPRPQHEHEHEQQQQQHQQQQQ